MDVSYRNRETIETSKVSICFQRSLIKLLQETPEKGLSLGASQKLPNSLNNIHLPTWNRRGHRRMWLLYFDKDGKTSCNPKTCLKQFNTISKRRLLVLLLVYTVCVCTATIIVAPMKCIPRARALEISTIVSVAAPYRTESTHSVSKSLPSPAQSQAAGQKHYFEYRFT